MKGILIVLLILSLNSFAKEERSSKKSSDGRESWYFNLGYGSSDQKIPGSIQAEFSEELANNASDLKLMMDLGFYFPLIGDSTLFGFSMTANTYTVTGDSELSLYTYLYSVSFMHFLFSSLPGSGLYLRGDYGYTCQVFGNGDNVTISGKGDGFLLEAGIGIAITKEARLLIGYYYSDKKIGSQDFIAHGLEVSLLF